MFLLKSSVLVLVLAVVTVRCDLAEKQLLKMIQEADQSKSVHLFGGLSLVKTEEPRSLSSNPNDISEVVSSFLDRHELTFEVPKEDQLQNGRSQLPMSHCTFCVDFAPLSSQTIFF